MELETGRYASTLFERIDEEKRARILQIAVAEFAAHGYAGANVNRIAQSAGISVGALYKYFPTKNDLFLYLLEEAAAKMSEYVNQIVNEDIRLLSKIEKLLRLAQSYSRVDPNLIRLYSAFMTEPDDARAAILAEKIEGITAPAYRALLVRAQEEGTIRADIDPGILAYMLDNQLINMQLSFACGYHSHRFKLFVGEQNAHDGEYVINSMMEAIKSMLQIASLP